MAEGANIEHRTSNVEHRTSNIEPGGMQGLDGLGDRVRECRLAAGLTVRQLAQLSALHHRTIERLEAGRTKAGPDCLTIVWLSEALMAAGAKKATVGYLLIG